MASSGEPQILESKSKSSTSRKKAEQTKKMELIREIHKLNIQIQKLEKEKLTHIFSKISDFREEFGGMEEEEIKLTEERKTEKVKIKQQLEKMSYLIKRFQRELRDVKPTPEFVEKLKSMMEEIEGTIYSFKEQHRMKYDDLMRSEKTLHLELQQLERKFDAWNQVSRTVSVAQTASSTVPTVTRDICKDLPPEVVAFDKFVQQSGGHQGGWDEQDHQTFLRYRNMYKGRIVFLDHVKPLLPTHTEAEIRAHESWFQEYMFLNESKKCAIKKWREKKEEDKEDAISQVQTKLDAEKEDKKRIITPEEKANKLNQINAWRVQKELEKAMKEEQKKREEIQKKKQEEEDKKNQLETKKKVEEFQRQKHLEEEVLAMIDEDRKREETERRREVMAKEISRFRNRDTQRLFEKLEKEREKEERRKEKEKKLEAIKFQVEASRDPSRLLMPTAGWNERLKDQGPSGGGQVFKIPHRAVPSWRQGML